MIKIFWTMNLNTLKRSFVLTKTPANLKISRPIIQSTRLLCASSKWDKTKLDSLVQNNKVVVFMKGVPAQPLCGFSNAVMQVLRMHGVDEFDSHNILDDEELRSEMKVYSNWPTFPQVYVGGELLGGCDIILQLHQNGELIDELSKVGIRSALLDKEKKK